MEVVGFCGFGSFGANRTNIYRTTMAVHIMSLVYAVVAFFALARNKGVLEALHWSKGEVSNSPINEIYLGLSHIYIRATGGEVVSKWDDIQCPTDFCRDCRNASYGTVTLAFIYIVASLPMIYLIVMRMNKETDTPEIKLASMIIGILGGLSCLSALATYGDVCFNGLPEELPPFTEDTDTAEERAHATSVIGLVADAATVEWMPGPGFVLFVLAMLMSFLVAFIHGLMPCPAPEEKTEDNPTAEAEVLKP